MVVLPYDTQRWPHVLTTLAAGGFGFAATVFILVGSLRSGTIARWRHAWGAALVAAALVNIAVYADIVLRDNGDSVVLPVVQKFATLFLALWMTATVLDTRSAQRSSPHKGSMPLREQALYDAMRDLVNAPPDAFVCKYVKPRDAIELILPGQTVRLSPLKDMNDPRKTEGGAFKCEAFVGDETPTDSFAVERRFGEDLRSHASAFYATRDDCEGDRNVMMRRGFGKSRMWAQYGADHTGVCLVFHRGLLESAARAVLAPERIWFGKVDYAREMLGAGAGAFFFDYQGFKTAPFEFLLCHAAKWHLSLFFRKHEDWEGESEWRIATIASEPSGCLVPYGAALKYVILGHRAHDDTTRKVRQLFDGPVLRLRYEQWREDCVLNTTEERC